MRKCPLIILVSLVLIIGCKSASKTTGKRYKEPPTIGGKSYSESQASLRDHNTYVLTEISDDETYGYSKENPIMVGGVKTEEGPLNERRFLNALTGPKGEMVRYSRTGSCCPFKTPNGTFNNTGLLDRYEVTYEGLGKPVYIYINMYDFGELKAPKGFAINKSGNLNSKL